MGKKVLSIRLSPTTAQRIDQLAKAINRPKSRLINQALEEYLEEYEDYLLALRRLNDKNDKMVSEKDMRKVLNRLC